jgi:hypothetical protein
MMCVAIELDPGDMYNASMSAFPSNAKGRKIDGGSGEENRLLPLVGCNGYRGRFR